MNPDADRLHSLWENQEPSEEGRPICDHHLIPVLMVNVNRGGFPEFVCPECNFEPPYTDEP